MPKGKNTALDNAEDGTLNQNPEGNTENASKFSKEQLIKADSYSNRRDILSALLEEDKMYSHADADRIIKEFLERKVK